MRRSEIIEGVEQIANALTESKMVESLQPLVSFGEKNEEFAATLATSLQTYFVMSQKFNSAAKYVSSIIDIDYLIEPNFWVQALSNKEGQLISPGLYSNLKFAKFELPKILNLLDREYLTSDKNNHEPIISNGKEMKLLSVTIFENDKGLSSPQRLINVLESVNTFYNVCAYIQDESPDTLSVVGCDSGSDKSFDFLGVAKVIECVTQLIENLWDRVIFFREKQLDARLDLINKTLPIYERIDELQGSGKIEPELAERLRRNISDGVNKFVESGAIIPEIDARSSYSSRALLSPVQKLLVSAPEETEESEPAKAQPFEAEPVTVEDTPSSDMQINQLSSDEKQQLSDLLEKMKNPLVAKKTEIAGDEENT